MRVLVSTAQYQGWRQSDFCYVPEGEIVIFTTECDRDRDDIDGGCGCRRSMTGSACYKGTTTAKVVKLDMDRDDLIAVIADGFKMSGQTATFSEAIDRAADMVDELMDIAATFPIGAVLEKRGDMFYQRNDERTSLN